MIITRVWIKIMAINLFRKALDDMNFDDEPLLTKKEVEHICSFEKRAGQKCHFEKRSKGDRKRNPRWRRE